MNYWPYLFLVALVAAIWLIVAKPKPPARPTQAQIERDTRARLITVEKELAQTRRELRDSNDCFAAYVMMQAAKTRPLLPDVRTR